MTGADVHFIAATVLLALGVSVPASLFSGGLLIALGCAYGVRAMRRTEGQRGLGITLFVGALVSLLAAILHPATKEVWLWGSLAVQAQMGVAGALSQSIAEGVIKFGRGLTDKIGDASNSIRLPGEGDGK